MFIAIGAKFVEVRSEAAWKSLCATIPDLQKLSAELKSPASAPGKGTPPDAGEEAAINTVAPGNWELTNGAWETTSNSAIGLVSLLPDDRFYKLLHDLAYSKGAEPLSSPRVATRDGQRAIIEIVREIRYPTAWEPYNGHLTPTTFKTKDLGASLDVTPHLDADGGITLDMTPEFSSFLAFLQEKKGTKPAIRSLHWDTGSFIRPVLSTVRTELKVTIPSGHTVLLACSLNDTGDQFQLGVGEPGLPHLPAERHIVLIFVTARKGSGKVGWWSGGVL